MNPATWLVLWVVVLVSAMNLSFPAVTVTAFCISVITTFSAPRRFFRLLKRSRWLLLSIVTVFAFMTPGLGLFSLPGVPAPTGEGLRLALDQVSRLVLAIALLSLLLAHLNRTDLVAGMRQLFDVWPLRRFDADLAALRLTLTLQLMERAGTDQDQRLWQSVPSGRDESASAPRTISLPVYPTRRLDTIILGLSVVTGLAALAPLLLDVVAGVVP